MKMKNFRAIILVVILSGAVWYLNYSLHFNGFTWNDPQDYNQIARNIYEGNGFSTSVLRPISFRAFQYLPQPEFVRPPFYPYLLAASYHIFGVNDFAVVLVNGLFYVLFVAMTFLFSLEFSGSRFTASAVAAIAALSVWFLNMSIIGSTDIVFAALFMAFLYVFIRHHEKPFLAGLMIGLLYLVRWNGAFIAAGFVLAEYNLIVDWRRWKKFLAFCAAVLLAASPILVRNMFYAGTAISAINSSGFFAGGKSLPGYYYISQLQTISGWEFIKAHPAEIYELIVGKFFMLVNGFPQEFGAVLLIVMAAGLFLDLKGEIQNRIKKAVIWIILVQTFLLILTNAEARYYGFLVPPLVLFAFVSASALWDKRIEAAASALVLFMVLFSSAGFWKAGKPLNYYQTLGRAVQASTEKGDVIISDLAWAMSWYGHRKAVWLTYDVDTMAKIAKKIPITYAFVSFETFAHPLVPYKDNVWQNLVLNPAPNHVPGFKLVKVFYLGKQPLGVLYRVLAETKGEGT
jgi:4-amino-4-deoxy-L-arabinose transferase-like glycosyltransferase